MLTALSTRDERAIAHLIVLSHLLVQVKFTWIGCCQNLAPRLGALIRLEVVDHTVDRLYERYLLDNFVAGLEGLLPFVGRRFDHTRET